MAIENGYNRVCHLHYTATYLRGLPPHENYGRNYDFLFLESIILLQYIFAHPSIPSFMSSLLWPQKLASTGSTIFTRQLPVYEADRPMKTVAVAVTFYF